MGNCCSGKTFKEKKSKTLSLQESLGSKTVSGMFIVQKDIDIKDDYKIGKSLGEGAFGKVYLGTNRHTEQELIHVIKEMKISRSGNDKRKFLKEVDFIK